MSGKARLAFTGTADLRGTAGFGTLLLDPYNLTISDAADSGMSGFSASGSDSVLNVNTLKSALNYANVLVTTGDGGTQAGDITVAAPLTWNASTTLTLSAYRDITVNAALTAQGSEGMIVLMAGRDVAVNATVTGENRSDVSLLAKRDVTVSAAMRGAKVVLWSDYGGIGTGTVRFGAGATVTASGGASILYNPTAYTAPTDYSGIAGAGTVVTGYMLVNTAENLQAIGTNLAGTYALGRDIDADATAGWNHGAGFAPLGSVATPFTGLLDGRDHAVSGLIINRPGSDDVGLFGVVGTGGAVRDVRMVGGSVLGANRVGALVGSNAGAVTWASATGTVTGRGGEVGGLVGSNSGTIGQSFATGAVTAQGGAVGGLVGSSSGTILQTYASGAVTAGGDQVGGLVGRVTAGSVTEAYALGSVTGTVRVGGLIGDNNGGAVTESYATGAVTGQVEAGGLIGANGGTVLGSFWDKQTTGLTNGVGSGAAGGMRGLTSDQIRNSTSVKDGQYFIVSGHKWYLNIFDRGPDFRPIGVWEAARKGVDGYAAISNLHQLVLINAGTDLVEYNRGDYRLAIDIDASETAGTNPAGIWGARGFLPIGSANNQFRGNFDGNGRVIKGLFINRPDTANVGLFGYVYGIANNKPIIKNIGLIDGQIIGENSNSVGGLVGGLNGGIVENSYFTGTVSGGFFVGGLVGESQSPMDQIRRSYAVASVTATENSAGGLVGDSYAQIDQSYASGRVTGASNVGGFIGRHYEGDITNSYWDTQTSGQQNGIGDATVTGLTGLTTAEARQASSYVGWDFTKDWYQSADMRPIGRWEAAKPGSDGVATVTNLHQLQLIDANPAGSYRLGADIDAQATSGVDAAGVWGAGGFTPLGTGGAGFTGRFDGRGHLIRGLTINRPTSDDVGLFGRIGSGGTVGYVGLDATSTVTGRDRVGAIAGLNGGIILQSFSRAGVSGQGLGTGGLVGLNAATIRQSYASGAVTGLGDGVGGLVGDNNVGGSIAQSYATGAVTGHGVGVGGLVGNNGASGSIAQSYATGAVSGQGAALGGLVGRNDGMTRLSYWNTQTSGMAAGAGAGSVTGVTGLDSAGMRDASSFTGFDRMVWAPADGTDAPLLYGVSGVVGVVQSAVYGDDPQTVPVSLLGGWAWSRVTGSASSTLVAGTNVGTYLNFLDTSGVSASFSAGGAARVVNVGAVVTPATLTVTADNGTMVYGDAAPSLGYTTSGWKNGQSDALLSGVTVSTSATALSDVGDYASTVTGGVLSGAAVGNYTIVHTTGTVSITPATLTVTAADGTMVYGDAVPSLGYTTFGWKNGQSGALLSGVGVSTNATALSDVGSAYTTTATGGTLSGAAAGNYTFSYVNGAFSVTPATLTVTAANGTMVYGDAVPSLGYATSGWKNGQSGALLSGVTVSTDATSLSNVGTAYITTATGGTLSGAAAGNYTLSYVSGSFAVTPATLTVTADNGTMVYGDAVPSLGYSVSGWKNGQSGALLSGVGVSTNATTLSDVGTAYLTTATGGTLSGAAAGNYTLSHVGGSFSVTPATLTVTAANGTMVYGDAVPSLGYTTSGWKNGQSGALLSDVSVSTNATTLSDVGSAYLTTATGGILSGAAAGNYTLSHVNGSFSVTPATLTVTAANGTMVYGDAVPSLGYATSGWKNGQSGALLSGVTVSTDATSLSNVGATYLTTATGGILSGAAAGNYTLSYVGGSFSVTPATLTVTAANGTMVYGDAVPSLGYATSGWKNGQSGALLSGVGVSTNATTLSDVGTAYLTTATGGTLSGGAAGNYTISHVGGSFSVTPATLTVTAANGTMVYGDAVPSLGYATSGWKNGQSDALLSGVGVSTNATTLSDVGSAYVTTATGGTLSGAAVGNYTLSHVGGSFSVTPATLTVTAANGTMVYGDAVPSLGYATSGWKNGQSDALLSGVGVSTNATTLSDVGTAYLTTATGGTLSGAAAGNYTFSYVNGAFSVTPATLTVTAANGTMVYGDAVPSLGYATSGWKNGQSGVLLSGVSVSTDATSLSNVGTAYLTTATGGTLSGAAAGNYTLSHVGGSFSVTPATLMVTAANGTMVYGDAVPSLGYSVSGWKNGQSGALLSGVGVSTSATTLSDVGTAYTTTATGGTLSGAATGNYTLSYVNGTFSVTPATLTVTADNGAMVYGDAVPSLGYATSGWKNGQSGALLSSVGVSTNATTLSDVGSAYVTTATGGTLSGGAAGNYTISHVGGSFSVTPATLTVTAANGTMVYGDAVPSLGYTTSGWRNGQGGALLSGVGVSTNATALSNVGNYTSTATGGALSGAAAGNYTLNHVNGAFSVMPATLTVTAANGTMVYGDAVPLLGYTTSGWRNGQSDALLSAVAVSTNATTLSNVGIYTSTATGGTLLGAAAGNYTLSHATGGVTITPAPLTVTAADGTMVYGDAVPSLGYSVSGWKNGQGDASLSGISASASATSVSSVGAYTTMATGGTLSGGAAGNYTLSYVNGSFTVTPATLTVTAANGTMIYGDTVSSLGYTISGWKNGQSDALLSGVTVSSDATSLSDVGTAYITTATGGTLAGAATGNYTISHVGGSFSVTPAALTVTAGNGMMVYGDAVPSLGYTSSGWKNGQSGALLSAVAVSTNATTLSDVGNAYVTTATGGTLSGSAVGNYTLSYVNGAFSVTPATLTVTAANGTLVYGDALSSLGYTTSGWRNGQSDALLSGVTVSTDVTSLSNVGVYASTAAGGTLSGAATGNYVLRHVDGSFSVTPATLTVTAANGAMVYGDTAPSVGYSVAGWKNGQGEALLSGVTVSTDATSLSNVGLYTSSTTGGILSGAAAGNYTLSRATGTVTITPATLTVTAANGAMVYGDAAPTLGYSVSGWRNGQSDALLSGVTVSTNASSLSDVGTSYFTTATGGALSGAAFGNYTLSYVGGSLSVTPAVLTVTAANGAMVYGDAVPSLGYTSTGWKNGQSDALLSGIGVSTNATTLSDVGAAYTTTAMGGTLAGAAAGNYTLAYVGGAFSVTPAALTVTAASGTMVYGDAVPSLGYAISGWKNGQGDALLSGVGVSTDATSLSNVGNYASTATGGTLSGAAAGNYTLNHVNGAISVTPATLTVTAGGGSMIYGDAVPSLSYTTAGWRNGQGGALLSAVTVSTDATSLSNVGAAYTTTATGGTLSGPAAGNYTLSYVDGVFSVTPATLTVTAANGTMVYGDAVPSLGYTTSGWRNGQSDALLSGVGISTDATSLSNVGTSYLTMATGGVLSGGATGNYTLAYVGGAFSVTPATLTVTAADATMIYGENVPALGYTTSGWKNGQGDASLSGISVSTGATSLSNVGTYASSATGGRLSGAAAGNYTLSHVGGTVLISPAPLTVTAGNGAMVYGDAVPSPGYGVSGWKNGQGDALLSGVTVSTNATALSDVGSAYLTSATGGTLSGAAAGNYTLSYVNGAFSVTPAVLTVTAANGTMAYGDAVPSLGYSVSGWRNGQNGALLSGVGVSTNATSLSNAGTAYITTATGGVLSGAAAGNYTLTHLGGTFSVTPATLTVTGADGTMVYGDAVPALGYTTSGWKNGQGDALISGIGVSTAVTSLSNAGAYVSTVTGGVLSGAAVGNYSLSHMTGTVTVTPAPLTVTAGNGMMVYGDAVPSLGYGVSGWRNGQSDALLSGVIVSTNATALSNVGAYASAATGGTLSGAAAGNYTIRYVNGAFAVTPAPLTVTAANGTMVLGDSVPSLGYSVSGWKNGQGDALLSGVGVSTSATSLSSVGRYVSTATGGVLSGDAAGNYTLRYVDGNLVIVQPPPVVVVDDPSRPAGTANPPSTDRPTASDPRATPGVPVELPPPSGIAAFLPARLIDPVAPSPAVPPVAGRSGSEAGSPGLASEQDGGGDGTQDACGAAGGEGCASLPHPANRVLGTFLSVKSP
ncbi:beta strand repeat-containing protein [Azospirillum brasilense]|uniref:beta strand repeat-containing protein n=1 Tax=Azospirillum brasilense TaxID=192 RepID=UPI001B3B6599|nr:MBG domain-containing protein [Azospirillum brasilense]